MANRVKIIKSNKSNDYISELKEWQDNQYNPGYYYRMDKIHKPIAVLKQFPVVFLIAGVLCLLISFLIFLKSQKDFQSIIMLISALLFSSVFIYAGIVRMVELKRIKNKSYKK